MHGSVAESWQLALPSVVKFARLHWRGFDRSSARRRDRQLDQLMGLAISSFSDLFARRESLWSRIDFSIVRSGIVPSFVRIALSDFCSPRVSLELHRIFSIILTPVAFASVERLLHRLSGANPAH